MEGWSLPDYGKIYMSDAYNAYARERGLGDPTALIEHHISHAEWEGQSVVLHDPSPWTFMGASGRLEGPPEAHEEFFVAHLATAKMRELASTDQPFSLTVSFWGPHNAYFPTEPYYSMIDPASIPEYPSFRDDYSGNRPVRNHMHHDVHMPGLNRWRGEWTIWSDILAKCYGQIAQTDDAIGQVLDSIDALGIKENSIVLFCADHGDAVASHDGLFDKSSTYLEEVARVPMAVRWPARYSGERRIGRPVTNMDLTATMLDAAGAEGEETMHSMSLLPLIEDPETNSRPRHAITEHNGHREDIVQRIVMTERYKYVAAFLDKDELYDLEADPYELTNLADEPRAADVKRELQHIIIDHLERTPDPYSKKLLYCLTHGL